MRVRISICLMVLLCTLYVFANNSASRTATIEALRAFEKKEYPEFIRLASNADQNNECIQFGLGYCYRYGEGCNEELKKSAYWYRMAAEQGMRPAQLALGYAYLEGAGVERDIDKAKQWLEKAKAGGLTVAEKELERLEKLDYIEAMLSLLDSSTVCALKAFEAGEWCEGFKLAQNAYRDNKKIQFYLGVCYHKGYGCKSNKAEAFKWYLKSAKQGLASAQLNVGIAYFEGWGGESDIDNAIVWLSKARENGDPVVHDDAVKVLEVVHTFLALTAANEARWWDFMKFSVDADQNDVHIQTLMGLCYLDAKGCEKDIDKALFWLKKAAENGSSDAQFSLGELYEGGEVQTDLGQASYWYAKASESRHEDALESRIRVDTLRAIAAFAEEMWQEGLRLAEIGDINNDIVQYFIGHCFECGLVKQKDMVKAAAAYANSAKGGVAAGQFCYARCLMNGIGVEKDIVESVQWLEKAAAQDYPDALYSYGKCFDTGTVVDKDKAMAEMYYRKSARHGYGPAKREIKKIATVKAKESFKNSRWKEAVSSAVEADLEDAEIEFYMAICYMDGLAVEKNLETAANWCAKALAQNYPKSGDLMRLIDTKRARKAFAEHDWARGFTLLATGDKDDAELLYWRGRCFENGYCVRLSLEKALEAYKVSFNKGYHESSNEIIRLESEILKTPKKYRDAMAQFSIAVNAIFPKEKVVRVPIGADIDKVIESCPDGGTLLLSAGMYSSNTYDKNMGHACSRNIRIVGISPEKTIVKGSFWINGHAESVVCMVENMTIQKAIESGSFDSAYLIGVAGSGICAINNCILEGSGVCGYDNSKMILHKVSVCNPTITCLHPHRNSQMIVLNSALRNLGGCGIFMSDKCKVYADGLTIDTSAEYGIYLCTGGGIFLRNSRIKNIERGFFDFSSDKYHGVGIISSDWNAPRTYCLLDNVTIEKCSEVGIVAEGEILSYNTAFLDCGKDYSGKLKILDSLPSGDMESFFSKEL